MNVPAGWKLVPINPYSDDELLAEQWNRGYVGQDDRKAPRGSQAERAWLEGRLAAHAVPPIESVIEPPSDRELREFQDQFSPQTFHCLKGAGIITFPQLKDATRVSLMNIPGFGKLAMK